MNFNEYREIFYFLQYQFYVRGEQHKKELECAANATTDFYTSLQELPIYNFLLKLVETGDEIHYAWDVKECQSKPQPAKIIQVKRPPRGMKKAEAEGKWPVPPRNVPVLISPQDMPSFPEDAYKYMIFEIPQGHRKNQITSMYKSLLVYDAVSNGFEEGSIAEAFRRENIASLIPLRNLSLYELIPDFAVFRCHAEKLILKKLFSTTLFSATEKKAETSHKNIFIDKREMDRYLIRAASLIHLAETGCFKEYPKHLR